MAKAGEKRKSQTVDQVQAAARAGTLEPLYYFYATVGSGGGSDKRNPDKGKRSPFNDYLLEQTLEAVKLACVGGKRNDFNFNAFIASETGMDKVLAVAQTYPMMAKRRLVIVKDAQDFRADDWRSAERYFKNPAPTTCLVLVGEQLPTRNKGGEAAKALVESTACCVAFAPFFRKNELLPYLDRELKARGLSFQRDAEALLLDLLGFDLTELCGALDKLALYLNGRGQVGVADIQACVARTKAEEIWGLLDALAEKKLAVALKHLLTYLDNAKQEDEILLIGQLIRSFTGLIDIRRLLDAGASEGEVLSAIGGNEWAAKKRMGQAKGHSLAGLLRSLRALQTLDMAVRSSRVPHHAHFERFVMRACGALPTP